jgi:hypothetical protein
MTKPIEQVRDELALAFKDSHKFFKSKRWDYIFREGFDAAITELTKRAGEFSENESMRVMPRLYEHIDRVDLWVMAQKQLSDQLQPRVAALEAELVCKQRTLEQIKRDNTPTEYMQELQDECARLREHLALALSFAPKGPVPEGLSPEFYHTLNYKDECELQKRIDAAREALSGREEGGE